MIFKICNINIPWYRMPIKYLIKLYLVCKILIIYIFNGKYTKNKKVNCKTHF